MKLIDIRREAGLSHVSDSTVMRALHEQGIKAYREEFKFILKDENMAIRKKYCEERKDWSVEKEWENHAFADEMAIEIGGLNGVSLVWRDKSE